MEIEIVVDYSLGFEGSVYVSYGSEDYVVDILEVDDNDYGDVNISLEGEGMSDVLLNVYNRYSLPDNEVKGYEKIIEEEESQIIEKIRESVYDYFSTRFEHEFDDFD